MRLNFVDFLLVILLCPLAQKQSWAEDEKPLQVCTPLSTGACSSLPRFAAAPMVKVSRTETSVESEGAVILNLVVASDGTPREIEVVESTENELRKIAVSAAKSRRFDPGTCEGKPVATQILARIAFHAVGDATVQLGSTLLSSANPEQVEKLAAEAGQALTRRDYPAAVASAREVLALAPLAKRIR